jgi:hypothetical protein
MFEIHFLEEIKPNIIQVILMSPLNRIFPPNLRMPRDLLSQLQQGWSSDLWFRAYMKPTKLRRIVGGEDQSSGGGRRGGDWGETAVAPLAGQWWKTIGRGCDEDSLATSIELA